MKRIKSLIVSLVTILMGSVCFSQTNQNFSIGSANQIIQETINTIDTIKTISYNQDMYRSNLQNINDTIYRYREIYFERLINDSIVGVKGHWYMYDANKKDILYEDIFDGNRLIRRNNKDSVARVYDLINYPEFKQSHFWSHNTLYAMQYEFKFMLNNINLFEIERLDDTIYNNIKCYCILISLKDKSTMPGFALKLEDSKGSISNTTYFIDKDTYYPIRIHAEFYTNNYQELVMFYDQRYYDIKFNKPINDNIIFNTKPSSLSGFEVKEVKPK